MLDLKLLRDLRRLWAQGLAVAALMAAGSATMLLGVGTHTSLFETRAAFYERTYFADLFVSLVRAPKSLARQITEISDVAAVQTRIVQSAVLDVEGMAEPASALLISLPDFHEQRLNRLYMREGRAPEPLSVREVVISESFAAAHGLHPGDSFKAILNGRKRSLQISGIALSAEYIHAVGPGQLLPDGARFGVIWMSEAALADLYDFEGAFNSLAVKLLQDAPQEEIMQKIDGMLEPYGGQPAYDRELQSSHAFLEAELLQLRGMSQVLPVSFLIVAAFLINMILSRMIDLERGQIGLLKALGYRSLTIGMHYVKFALLVALVGAGLGVLLGIWMGRQLTILYGEFFHFPFLIFIESPSVMLFSTLLCMLAAIAGAVRAVRGVVALPAAQAMAPPAPQRYRRIFGGRGLGLLPHRMVISLRHIARRPVRAALTCIGIALPVALLTAAFAPYNSLETMIDISYFQTERQSATISFGNDRHDSALINVRQLPEILQAEAFRMVPVVLEHKQFSRRVGITGKPEGAYLSRIVGVDLKPIPVPEHGIVLTERLANLLHAQHGDIIHVRVLSGKQAAFDIVVSQIAQTYIGLSAMMNLDLLNEMLDEGPRISGVHAGFDTDQQNALYDRIKSLPAVADVALLKNALNNFRATIAENINIGMTVYIILGVLMAFGVVYNSGRIQLSERARELSSLSVLGFTRGEVSRIMLGEIAVLTMLALPVGWLAGYGLTYLMIEGFSNDLYGMPLVVSRRLFADAGGIVLLSAVACAFVIYRRIRQMDINEVLKARD